MTYSKNVLNIYFIYIYIYIYKIKDISRPISPRFSPNVFLLIVLNVFVISTFFQKVFLEIDHGIFIIFLSRWLI